MVRPVDRAAIDDLIELADDILVGHHQSNLEIFPATTPKMRDTTFALK